MNESPSRRPAAFGLGRRAVAVAVLALGLFALAPGTASAAVPANDNFSTATMIDPSSLPFSDAVTIDDATLEGGEPSGCYVAGKSIGVSDRRCQGVRNVREQRGWRAQGHAVRINRADRKRNHHNISRAAQRDIERARRSISRGRQRERI